VWDAAIRRVAQITGIRWSKWEQTVRSTMLQLGDSWPTDPALANILRDDGAVNLIHGHFPLHFVVLFFRIRFEIASDTWQSALAELKAIGGVQKLSPSFLYHFISTTCSHHICRTMHMLLNLWLRTSNTLSAFLTHVCPPPPPHPPRRILFRRLQDYSRQGSAAGVAALHPPR
jgi:hypothetical protein